MFQTTGRLRARRVVGPARRRVRVVAEVLAQLFDVLAAHGREGLRGHTARRRRSPAALPPPRTASAIPTIAATTRIATPSATNQRFRRRDPPDSTRRWGACGPLLRALARAGRRRDAALLLLGHGSAKGIKRSRAPVCRRSRPRPSSSDDHGRGRERLEEAPPIGARVQARVEDRDDAFVRVAADQAAEPLPQLQHRRRERILGEPVSALPARSARSGPRRAGSPGAENGSLSIDEQRERLALDVHSLPERRGREEDRVDVVAKALEQPLARRIALARAPGTGARPAQRSTSSSRAR